MKLLITVMCKNSVVSSRGPECILSINNDETGDLHDVNNLQTYSYELYMIRPAQHAIPAKTTQLRNWRTAERMSCVLALVKAGTSSHIRCRDTHYIVLYGV